MVMLKVQLMFSRTGCLNICGRIKSEKKEENIDADRWNDKCCLHLHMDGLSSLKSSNLKLLLIQY